MWTVDWPSLTKRSSITTHNYYIFGFSTIKLWAGPPLGIIEAHVKRNGGHFLVRLAPHRGARRTRCDGFTAHFCNPEVGLLVGYSTYIWSIPSKILKISLEQLQLMLASPYYIKKAKRYKLPIWHLRLVKQSMLTYWKKSLLILADFLWAFAWIKRHTAACLEHSDQQVFMNSVTMNYAPTVFRLF